MTVQSRHELAFVQMTLCNNETQDSKKKRSDYKDAKRSKTNEKRPLQLLMLH